MAEAPIAFVDLAAQRERLGDGVQRAIGRVLDHGRFIMGPEVFELEERLAERAGVRHAVACSSGTDALLLALMAWGVGPGDAVIVPSFTFAATAEVVALLGASPVFADVDEDTFNVTADVAARAIEVADTAGLDAVGIIAVDLFGQPANYGALGYMAREHELWLLADAAQSFGATWDGQAVGSLADVTTTSFFPAKPLGCFGDGGAVLTDDADIAAVLRSLRVHGQGADKYDNVRIGMNGRLDTIQAAVLLEKLKIFDDELLLRNEVATRYRDALSDALQVPEIAPSATSAWAQYTIRVDARDHVMTQLSGQGIPTAVYYARPLHDQDAYETYPRAQDLGVSERLSRTVLSLPFHPYLTETQQDRIASHLRFAVGADGSVT